MSIDSWANRRVKYLVRRCTEKAPVEPGSHYVGLENIESWTGKYLDSEALIEADASVFKAGDVLFGKLRPYLAKVHPAQIDGSCTSEVLVLRPNPGVLQEFLFFRLLSGDFIDRVNASTFGAKMPRADWETIGNLLIAVPSEPEQRSIIRFVRRETSKIDDLIAKKQRLIELLDEKRSALISRVVTQGLSGRRCSWAEGRLGRFIRLQRGFDITGAEFASGRFPVISSGGPSGFTETAMVKGPGVVAGRKGTVGTVYYCESDYWPHDTTLFVQNFRNSVPRFVYYLLLHLNLVRFDVGAANPTINRNHIHPERVRWPDAENQELICSFLDKELEKAATIVSAIQAAIALLREYRS